MYKYIEIMRAYKASFEAIYWRFHLIIAIVVGAFAVGYPLLGILSVPVFLTCLLGISFKNERPNRRTKIQVKHSVGDERKATAA